MGGGRGGSSSKLSKLSSGGDGGGAGISRSKCASTHKVNKLTKLTKCKSTFVITIVFEGDVWFPLNKPHQTKLWKKSFHLKHGRPHWPSNNATNNNASLILSNKIMSQFQSLLTSLSTLNIKQLHRVQCYTTGVGPWSWLKLHFFLLIFFLEVIYSWLSTCFSILVIVLL